jgi:hypothetical protein
MTTPGSTSTVLGAVAEGSAAASRMLSKLRHDPAAIAVTLAVPVVLVLMFGYLLGSAIPVPAVATTASSLCRVSWRCWRST